MALEFACSEDLKSKIISDFIHSTIYAESFSLCRLWLLYSIVFLTQHLKVEFRTRLGSLSMLHFFSIFLAWPGLFDFNDFQIITRPVLPFYFGLSSHAALQSYSHDTITFPNQLLRILRHGTEARGPC